METRLLKYHGRNSWLFALWGLWNHCRKGSEAREFYQAWWLDA